MSQYAFGPDDERDNKRNKKYSNWREAVYEKPASNNNNNPSWRDSEQRGRYTNAVGVTDTFSLLRDNRITTKKDIDSKLPVEFTDITPAEAEKAGFCEETRNRMNQVRAQKRQQFYQARGLRPYEE